MDYHHFTYFAYGLRIPTDTPAWQETGHIDQELATIKDRCPDVEYLSAGAYDDDMVFLVTASDEIELGSYGRANLTTAAQYATWDAQLAIAVDHLGYSHSPDLEAPGWLCIPDLA